MNLLRLIQRPEYFFRPQQIWRRLLKNSLSARNAIQLAWGLPVNVDPRSHVGVDILNLGVYDRIVPEAIYRLSDPGDAALDIGANIGQNASMLALKLGPRGSVIAFEPGPESCRLLIQNLHDWERYDLSPISLVRLGVSSHTGPGLLHEADELGGYSLEDEAPGPPHTVPEGAQGINIELTSLDSFLPPEAQIGVIKMDIEGHELSALHGARRLLEEKRLRDIVFEDFYPQPSPVTKLLQAAGYTVLSLFPGWRKPILRTLEQHGKRRLRQYELTNFLGTRDPARALARFEKAGWECLKVRARLRE